MCLRVTEDWFHVDEQKLMSATDINKQKMSGLGYECYD